MIKGVKIEIFEIQNPQGYDQSGFSFCIEEEGKEYEYSTENTILYLFRTNSYESRIFLIYKGREIGRCDIDLKKLDNGNVQVFKYSDSISSGRSPLSKTTKQITVRAYVKGIFEAPSQEYLNFLKIYVAYLSNQRNHDLQIYENLGRITEPKNEGCADRTVELLEKQLAEKNKIIQSFLKEFNELRKNTLSLSNENIELKKKVNESFENLKEIDENFKFSEGKFSDLDTLSKKDQVIAELEKRVEEVVKENESLMSDLEERTKDFNFLIEKIVTEKNATLKKNEELEKSLKNLATDFEDQKIQVLNFKSKISVLESSNLILKSNEKTVKSLELELFNEKENTKRIASELTTIQKSLQEQTFSFLKESSENIELKKRLFDQQSSIESSNFSLLKSLNEKANAESKLIIIEKSLLEHEELKRNLKCLKEINANLSYDIESLSRLNSQHLNDFENLDEKYRTLILKTAKQEKLIRDKDEELESLKEIVIELQKIPNFSRAETEHHEVRKTSRNSLNLSGSNGRMKIGKGSINKSIGKGLVVNSLDFPIEEVFEELTARDAGNESQKKAKMKGLTVRNSGSRCRVKNFSPSSCMKENLVHNKSFTSTQRIFVNKSPKNNLS